MPFVGDTFGLNSVYDRQVSNIEQRNVLNWPEYPTYGYFAGGVTVNAPGQTSTISRLDLATNVSSLPGRNLPATRIDLQSFSNNFYGYFNGGTSNTVIRLDFSNETVSLPGKNLTQLSRANQATVSNSLYGYFGGGYAPGLASIISRLEFSSETVSNPGKNFAPSRGRFAAVSSSIYGYFGGGYTPTLRSTITRLDFSNETLTDPGKNLPTGIGDHSSLSNISYGYFGGGSGVCTINRLDFSNETVSAPGKNLPSIRRNPLTFSSSTATVSLNGSYGYFGGGGIPTGSGLTDIIQTIDFATENINTLSAVLSQQVRQGAAVANAGSSFRTNSKTYGYTIGGFGTNYVSTVSRLDFSTENMTNPGKNLPAVRGNFSGAISSNSYGYFGGGYTPVVTMICTITRLDFSNETLVDPGKDLSRRYSNCGGVSSNNYGYFGGGYVTIPSPAFRLCTITRLDFSSENVNEISSTLLDFNIDSMATVMNNSYGYFGGGRTGGPGTCTSNITRLDFSNETTSAPSTKLPANIFELAALSSNSYGYFGGGVTPPGAPSYTNTITRLDFSNDTLSPPGKNLPTELYRSSTLSNNFYGYFIGGWFPIVSTVIRLDFSSDTISAPGKNAPTPISQSATFSNSN